MRLQKYILNELISKYSKGITFVDVDCTIFNSTATIHVLKDGSVIRKLSNQEFNTYKLQPGESFDFMFGDADLFYNTSTPIIPIIDRIKRMFKNIEKRDSKIVILTARKEFKDMKTFRKTFTKYGIPIHKITIEFNKDNGSSISVNKKNAILKYLLSGEYRRVRLLDDDLTNIRKFLSIQNELPQDVINKVKEKHNIPEDEKFPVISFYGLLVLPNGKISEIK